MTSALTTPDPGADVAPALDSPPCDAGATTNPKSKASGYKQDPLGFYIEPVWCVAVLFEALRFKDAVYDPCCGIYTIPKVAASFGLRASGRDIVARSPHQLDCRDFLEDQEVVEFPPPNIVTNPPYGIAKAVAEKALRIAYQKTAILVRLDFLASQRRHALFADHPPAYVLILSRRPSMPPGELLLRGGVKQTGGQHDYTWIIWDRARSLYPTELRWLK